MNNANNTESKAVRSGPAIHCRDANDVVLCKTRMSRITSANETQFQAADPIRRCKRCAALFTAK